MIKTSLSEIKAPRMYPNFGSIAEPIKKYAVFMLDQNGNISSWNRGARLITGWSEKEVIGKHFRLLYSKPVRQSQKSAKELRTALKEGTYEAMDYIVTKKGEILLADITITTLPESMKMPEVFVCILKDITIQHKQEVDQIDANTDLRQEIRRRKNIEKALKDSNAELEAFASAASHDLQEPLRMIVSYLQLIDRRYRDKFDSDGREFLAFAVDGANRMRTLISDLVDYARVDKLAKPFKNVKTNELVDRVINNLSLSASDKGVTIRRESLPDIYGDDIQLNQLFQNLIANAIKFSDKKPSLVHIGYSKQEAEYVFFVKDNGRGIAKKDYSRIFLIFKQMGSRADRQGNGVGLAISKKIVHRHSGKIWVDSQEGVGSTFFFTIPVHNDKKGVVRG